MANDVGTLDTSIEYWPVLSVLVLSVWVYFPPKVCDALITALSNGSPVAISFTLPAICTFLMACN